jgi:hypothetical protein
LLSALTPIYLQGYLLASPVPAEKVLSLIATVPEHIASLLLTSSAKPASQHASPDEPALFEAASRSR